METPRPIAAALVRDAQTGNDGRLRLDDLLTGVWNMHAERDSEEAAVEEVQLEPGELRELELVLERRDSLRQPSSP